MVVDHIDGNGLNNTRANLRICTIAENVRSSRRRTDNGSGYKGVGFHKASGKWVARIVTNGEKMYLGLYESPEQAAAVYDLAAHKYHGEFARLNFPERIIPTNAGLLSCL
jgi:hypothetical protein